MPYESVFKSRLDRNNLFRLIIESLNGYNLKKEGLPTLATHFVSEYLEVSNQTTYNYLIDNIYQVIPQFKLKVLIDEYYKMRPTLEFHSDADELDVIAVNKQIDAITEYKE